MKAAMTCAGPTNAPAAANSLTSPAPVAPIRCPGSISARPSARPASEAPSDRPPMPHAAETPPTAASPIVSGFGTRRVRRSIAAPMPVPATRVAIAINSEGLANLHPENVVDRVAERFDADHGDDRNQRRQQSVFDQILARLVREQPLHCRDQVRHGVCLSMRERSPAPLPIEIQWTRLRRRRESGA